MNCKIIISQLDDYIDAELNPAQQSQFDVHLSECESCHQAWQQELQFRQLMKEHDVPAPDAGFEDRAFAKLPGKTSSHHQSARKSVQKSAFIAGFGGAIAAGIVLFIAAALFINPVTQQQAIPNIQLTLHQAKKVNMVFDVPEMVAEATFSMQVPQHIDIAGRKGLHQLEWKTALKKGKNLLSLPIVAQSAEGGELVAKIKYGNQEKVFRLLLDIQKLDVDSIEQGMFTIINKAV